MHAKLTPREERDNPTAASRANQFVMEQMSSTENCRFSLKMVEQKSQVLSLPGQKSLRMRKYQTVDFGGSCNVMSYMTESFLNMLCASYGRYVGPLHAELPSHFAGHFVVESHESNFATYCNGLHTYEITELSPE